MMSLKSKSRTDSIANAKIILAGGLAGCMSKTTVAPLDRCKILLQTHHHHFKNFGLLEVFRGLYEREGLLGFYRSNGAQMLRIFPYAATQFFSYEKYKVLLSTPGQGLSNFRRLSAGSLAGITSVLLTYPLDVIRAKLAFQLSGEQVYAGIVDVFSLTMKRDGVFGLYRGIVPTLIGMTPYAGISFFTFEKIKEELLRYLPQYFGTPNPVGDGSSLILTMPGKLFSGSVAGAFAQTVAYPLDVVRRHMQVGVILQDLGDQRISWVRVFIKVYKENGVRKGLYRGLSINYLRASPMVAMSFATYESLKQFFNLSTAL